ncbi:GTP cyclohydrolase I [Nocardioides sp. YIM 152315]|uniref:GTP cyclohydrolase I n=1 Tax=Nocardioides sp. YIM 152315 TaxID=3031760 RepID=UPI0023DA1DE1|nr:GTP cyclohydrolase I [Nocardioides sp. YIM 152315]MDF1603225.1 GTP cyclohydrolase I [Nocardioides sp. YIM 152315]
MGCAGEEGEAHLRGQAEAGLRALIRLMGDDPDRPGVTETPARVVQAYLELAEQPGDPAVLLGTVFDDVEYPSDEMIAVGPIDFVSICEHHLLPFTGQAWVGYVPGGAGVVGLSKLARLVDHYARRPQVQERLTTQIVQALVDHLDPQGAGCVVRSSHACMGLRGVRKPGAVMVTSVLRGLMRRDPASRAEFMALTNGGR